MKPCIHCDAHIPDNAYRCPHCRAVHPRRGWLFQAFLVAVVVATAAVVLFG